MARKITIEPVTRVEGHGKVTIQLDDEGKVARSRFHIVEFRGFERFVQGRPYWEAPVLVQRLCGICPVSHHLAAANELGEGVRQDLPRAIELYEQACSSEYVDSCLALATLYTEGTLLPPDAAKVAGYNARALQIYIDGCEAGNSPDCLQRDRLRTRIQLQQLQGVPGVTPGVIRPPGLLP